MPEGVLPSPSLFSPGCAKPFFPITALKGSKTVSQMPACFSKVRTFCSVKKKELLVVTRITWEDLPILSSGNADSASALSMEAEGRKRHADNERIAKRTVNER